MPLDRFVRVYSNEHLIGILSEMGSISKPNFSTFSTLILDSPVESIILSTKPNQVLTQQRRVARGTQRITSTPNRVNNRGSFTPMSTNQKYRNNNSKYDGSFNFLNDFDEQVPLRKSFEDKPLNQDLIDAKNDQALKENQKSDEKKDPFDVRKPSHFYSLVHNSMNESSTCFIINKTVRLDNEVKNECQNEMASCFSAEAEYVTANDTQINEKLAKDQIHPDPVVEALSSAIKLLEDDLYVTENKASEVLNKPEEENLSQIKDEPVYTEDKESMITSQESLENIDVSLKKVKKKEIVKFDPEDGFVGFIEKKKPLKKKMDFTDVKRASNRSSSRNFNNSGQRLVTSNKIINKSSSSRGTYERGAVRFSNKKTRENVIMKNSSDVNKSLLKSGFKKSDDFKDDRFISIDEIIKETKKEEKKEGTVKSKPSLVVKPQPLDEPVLTIEQIAAEQRREELMNNQNKKASGPGFWNNVMNMF